MRAVPVATGLAAAVGGVAAAERVLRRRRPRTAYGRYARWTHPGGLLAGPAEAVANSLVLRALGETLPVPAMVSAITDVVYVNYVVEAGRLAPLVPAGLDLQRVGDHAVLSFLAYRHGHLGPARLGRRFGALLPSPVQTNWRLYVRDRRTGVAGVYFLSTAVDHLLYALGGRVLCEGLPMHLLRAASVDDRPDGTVNLTIDPGAGSGPDATAVLRRTPPPVDGPWRVAFGTWDDLLTHVVPQDRALSVQPWRAGVTRQEIQLGIAASDCVPLAGPVGSRYARDLVGDAEPVSFLVPRVDFRFLGETRLSPAP